MIVTPKIFARIVAIAILGVLLQLSFFSRVELFHTSPDVLPALVVSLGLLGGSMTGAVAGFSIGLPGRLPAGRAARRLLAGPARRRLPRRPLPRALRDPQRPGAAAALHGADPVRRAGLRRGAADARDRRPVSVLIVRDMLLKSVYAFFLGWPIYLGAAAGAAPGAGRGAEGARAAGSRPCWEPEAAMYLRSDERGPQMSNRLALRIALFGGVALVALRRALLPPLVPAGARTATVPGRGEQQPHPRVPGQRPARRDPRPQRQGAGRQPHQPRAPGQPAEAARRPARSAAPSWRGSPTSPTAPCAGCARRCTKS